MDRYENLHHTKWDCKYHLVWIPKYPNRVLCGEIPKELGPILRELAMQKESELVEGLSNGDHVHTLASIPPKYSVSRVMGYMKGKSAIAIARQFNGKERNFTGEHFWARGYAVSTVGFELEQIQRYIREQESSDDEGRF